MFKNKKQDKFDRYTDPTGEFSNRSLKIAGWYVRNKILLKKVLIYSLISWNVITLSIGIFVFAKFFLFDMVRDEHNIVQMVSVGISQQALDARLPEDLIVGTQKVYDAGSNKYDFSIEFVNPNELWMAQVEYQFTFSDSQTRKESQTILPGQQGLLVIFGEEIKRQPVNVKFELLNIEWQRVNRHNFSEPINYINQRLNFVVNDFVFQPAGSLEDFSSDSVTFTLTNDSLFSYRQSEFLLVFKDGNATTAIVPLFIDNFSAGTTQEISMNLFLPNFFATDVMVQPLINVFDNDVFATTF